MTDREKVAMAICAKDQRIGYTGMDRWRVFNDYYFRMADAAIAALRPEAQDGVAEAARPMSSAPRDHTLIHLLVRYDRDQMVPLEDADVAWTVGHNGFDHTGIDEWQFVGWSWQQDCFVDQVSPDDGTPIGWRPLRALSRAEDT